MDELKAREFVAGSPGSRGVVLKFDLDIVEQQPTTLNGKVVFLGKIRSVTALRTDYPIPLAVLSTDTATGLSGRPQPQPVGDTGNTVGATLIDILSKSCNAGKAKDCERVAYIYLHGQGAPVDIHAAQEFYAKSCSLGNKQACTVAKELK